MFICSIQLAHSASDLLSPAERAWLAEHPDIRVSVSADYPPIFFTDKNGKNAGLVDDYFDLIEERLGIKFQYVVQDLAQRAETDPKKKQADLIPIYAETPERNKYWNYTKPYLDYPLYLIARADSPAGVSLKTLNNQRVVVVNHYAAHEYLSENYPQIILDTVADTCTGLQHVAFNIRVAMLTDLPVASWCLRDQGLVNLKVIEKTEFQYKMGIAVRKDWPMLQSIMDKGLASITDSEREDIYQHWVGSNLFEQTWLQKYHLWIASAALFLIGLALVRLYIWDRTTQTRILRRFSGYNVESDNKSGAQKLSRNPLRKMIRPGIAIFLIALVIVFYFFEAVYHLSTKTDREFLLLIIGVLISFALAGGYILGGLRRAREVENLFCKLLEQFNLRSKTEHLLNEHEQRLARQNDALRTLTVGQLDKNKKLKEVYSELTELSANTLDVNRVSVWLFNETHLQLECMDLYERANKSHSAGFKLEAKDYPKYFQALAVQRVIAADNAVKHKATAELSAYLIKYNIGAMLDATIWLDNQVIGVVCHEHVGQNREWTLDEENFAGSIADFAHICIEAQKRYDAEDALQIHTDHLEELVKTRTASLENSANMSKFVIENAPATIITLDLEGNILDMNPAAQRLSGYSREYAIGKNYNHLFLEGGYIGDASTLFDELKAGKKIRGEEFIFQRKDGSKVELSVSRSIELDANGKPIVISIGQDISRQKAVEAELVKAREAAESADRIKSMFVASMSHELRTPLNSIIGFLGIVLQGMSGDLTSKQRDQLSRAYQSSKHLLALISDVIDISKIEAGFLQTHVEKFELKPLLLEAEQVVRHIADDKKLEVRIECAAHIGLETDKKRLFQVVLNVLSNAVKYTEKGKVKLKAKVHKGQLIISTQDTGIGISKEGLERIFKPFERADSRLKIKTLGTGLGLYLTRKILTQLLGGSIEVESELEVGSTFTIKLPLVAPEVSQDQAASILEMP